MMSVLIKASRNIRSLPKALSPHRGGSDSTDTSKSHTTTRVETNDHGYSPQNMSNDPNNPNSPSSALSKKARLAHWITGGTNRGPSTMSSFSRMARDRNDFKKAKEAWALARERALAEHQGQWGRSGVLGAVDQARGTAPRPNGKALIRCFREGGGGGGGRGEVGGEGRPGAEDAAGQPEMQQQARQGGPQTEPSDGDLEDDIYGADDDTMGARAEGGNTGNGDTAVGTATGHGVGQQQTAEGGGDQHPGTPVPTAQ